MSKRHPFSIGNIQGLAINDGGMVCRAEMLLTNAPEPELQQALGQQTPPGKSYLPDNEFG